jgi:hypothetical protein
VEVKKAKEKKRLKKLDLIKQEKDRQEERKKGEIKTVKGKDSRKRVRRTE